MIAGFGIILTLILLSVPFAMDYAIERYFLANGADQTEVEDVNFNPFTRRLVVKNLIVKVDNEPVLDVAEAGFTFSWSPFLRKRFLLEKVDLSHSSILIEELSDGRWRFGGLLFEPPEDRSTDSSWGFGLVRFQVQNSLVKFRSAQLTSDFKLEQARLTHLRSWLPRQNARLELKGDFNHSPLNFEGDFAFFGTETRVDGTLKLQKLALTPLARLIAEAPDRWQGRLDADVRIQSQYSSEKGLNFQQTGRLVLEETRMQFENVDLADENLTWEGTLQIKSPAGANGLQIAAAGQLKGNGGFINPAPENLKLHHSGLSWHGKFALEHKPQTADFTVQGALLLKAFQMDAADLKLDDKNFSWDGVVRVQLPAEGDSFQVDVAGREPRRGDRDQPPQLVVAVLGDRAVRQRERLKRRVVVVGVGALEAEAVGDCLEPSERIVGVGN